MNKYILPEHISPTHYDLTFEPSIPKKSFQGTAKINIKLKEPTKSITLHALELSINEALVILNNKSLFPKISHNKETQTITLTLPEKISKEATLHFQFKGILNDTLAGWYLSSYEHKNKTKQLAVTQFEAPYARKAFPCFDQPDKKATFSITMTVPKNLEAISNMPELSVKKLKTKKLITFEKTPLTSSYLIFLGVGEFEFLTSKYKKTTIRIATTPGKSSQGKFALDCTKKFLSYFESYSGIPYPLPKLDLISIPDFNAGAMENWGAITFREVLLLTHKKTSFAVKRRVAEVIAHELWHQWSGNLVTMKWWDDLWLNESFATYMAFKAVDHYYPTWNMFSDFASETDGALAADMLHSTHPINVSVSNPNEIEEIFDEISYGKGGSVLRMLESFLSPKVFQKGVQNYLNKFKYKNAEAKDLWEHLDEVSSAPVKKIMTSWITQPGFPVVDCKLSNNLLYIKQSSINPKQKATWQIPIVLKTDKKTTKLLLDKPSTKINLKHKPKWLTLNLNQQGFYMVNYDTPLIEKLKDPIENKKIPSLDRKAIQNDFFSLSLQNKISLGHFLTISNYYEKETNPYVLSSLYGNFRTVANSYCQESYWPKIWTALAIKSTAPFSKNLSRLSWKPKSKDSPEETLMRSLCINALSFFEDKKTIQSGLKISDPHPDLEGSLLLLKARAGNLETFKSLQKRYNTTNNIEQKLKTLVALYQFRDKNVTSPALSFALSKQVRTQDLRRVFASISTNPEFSSHFLPWCKKKWGTLKHYQHSSFIFMGLLESLISIQSNDKSLQDVKRFLTQQKVAYEMTKAKAFEAQERNFKWRKANKDILQKFYSE